MSLEIDEVKANKREIGTCIIDNFIQFSNITKKTFKKCRAHYIRAYINEAARIKENNKKSIKHLNN